MTHVFTSTEVELFNGAAFDPSAPAADAITLDLVAQGLSCLCRYGGQCRQFFTVAEHAVLVALKLRKIGASLPLQFAGLHHDDHESVDGFGDIQAPAKGLLPTDYHERVRVIDATVCRALGSIGGRVLWTPGMLHDPLVKRCDLWAKRFEARHLMPSQGRGWLPDDEDGSGMAPIPEHDDDEVRCLLPVEAKLAFLDHHFLLCGEAVRDRD